MPIDPTPEGGEILHQPVVKPFPQKTDKTEETSLDEGQEAAAVIAETPPAEDENQPGFIGTRNRSDSGTV